MRYHLGLAAVTVFVLLSRTATADDLSRVFVYSQRETPARSWMTVLCDGERIADVRRGFFFIVNVRPGRHSLSLADGVPVSVEVRSGGEVFVRIDWSHDVRRQPIPVFNSVVEERAKREMRFLSYVEAKRIHSTAVAGADPRPPDNPQLKTRKPR
jgi:hypothetical protein